MDTFNPGPRVRRIEFDDTTPFPGLWMRVGGMSFDEWLDLKVGEAVKLFADRLLEWNWVDDTGEPVPCTREGVGSLDASDVATVVSAWSDRVAEVHRGLYHPPPPQRRRLRTRSSRL